MIITSEIFLFSLYPKRSKISRKFISLIDFTQIEQKTTYNSDGTVIETDYNNGKKYRTYERRVDESGMIGDDIIKLTEYKKDGTIKFVFIPSSNDGSWNGTFYDANGKVIDRDLALQFEEPHDLSLYYPTGELESVVTFGVDGYSTKKIDYYKNGKIKSYIEYLPDKSGNEKILKKYNEQGKIIFDMERNVHQFSYEYHPNGKMKMSEKFFFNTSPGKGYSEYIEYDVDGNEIEREVEDFIMG